MNNQSCKTIEVYSTQDMQTVKYEYCLSKLARENTFMLYVRNASKELIGSAYIESTKSMEEILSSISEEFIKEVVNECQEKWKEKIATAVIPSGSYIPCYIHNSNKFQRQILEQE
ncbi:MAG: hypothetical protein QXW65_00760 [Candidatus Pacearchaeota archaeon]